MSLGVETIAALPRFAEWGAFGAYGNGVHVVGARDGSGRAIAAVSSDGGVTWSEPVLCHATSLGVFRLRFVQNAFFMYFNVNASVTVLRSVDGLTWAPVTMPANVVWRGIAYGAGTFVAIASGVSTATSTDGVTWVAGTAVTNRAYYDVAFGLGLFVAIVNSPNNLYMTSPDGVTWTQRSGTMIQMVGIAFNGTTFVCYSDSGTGYISYSTSGTAWTGTTMGQSIGQMAVLGTTFVGATTGNLGTYKTSPDGITWTARTFPTTAYWRGLSSSGSALVAVQYNSRETARSSDGVNWVSGGFVYGTTSAMSGSGVLFADGKFVVAPYYMDDRYYFTSTDGRNWSTRQLPAFTFVAGQMFASVLAWTGTKFFYSSSNYYACMTSLDAENWTEIQMPLIPYAVAIVGGTIVAFGTTWPGGIGQNCVSYSADHGATWSAATYVGSAGVADMAFGAGLNVTCSMSSTVYYTSPDLVTWTARPRPGVETIRRAIIWTGAYFLTAAPKNVYKSYDGITWTTHALPAPAPTATDAAYKIITHAGRHYLFVYNAVYSSPDGESWKTEVYPAAWANSYIYAAYGAGKFLGATSSAEYLFTLGPFWTGFIGCEATA